jgi:FeS assembly SUF system protein
MDKEVLKGKVISTLKLVYDPEIPVDVYNLGLIYKIIPDEEGNIDLTMTLTAPNCPVADNIVQEIYEKIKQIEEVNSVNINLVFDPPWNPSMASEIAQLQLGML